MGFELRYGRIDVHRVAQVADAKHVAAVPSA